MPVAIDGVTIDAVSAPILLDNTVGGYFPANVATAAGVGEGGVNAAMYWDQGHGSNIDADAFLSWISQITGYPRA